MSADVTEAETMLVSACWSNPDALHFAIEIVAPPDFLNNRLGALYALLVGMRGSGQPITPQTVITEAQLRDPQRNRYPSLNEMRSLAVAMIPASTVSYYAEIIRAEATRRTTMAAAQHIYAQAAATDEPAQAAALAAAHFVTIRDQHRSGGMKAQTLGELLEGDDDYHWIIPGLLEEGDRLILTGLEGGGKTTLIRQMAICAAAGLNPFNFQAIKPVAVLYIDVENSERQWRRNARGIATRAAMSGGRDPRQHMHVVNSRRLNILTDRDLGAIHRLVDEHKPQILVIGPLYKLVPGAITNDDDAAPLITALDSLRDRGLCLLMEAHTGLAGRADRDLRPRGSSALMAWPEFGYGITTGKEANVWDLVRWRGDRDQRSWPESLVRGGSWPWTDLNHTPQVAREHWSDR